MEPSGDISGISDEATSIFSWVIFSGICHIISMFGIVTNIINIICFAKQGFEDSVNISLLGLAVSDLGNLATMISTCVYLTPALLAADLPFEPMDVLYLSSGMTHLSFTRVSSCITAMITIERCLCITAPLQVKSLITPKRVAVTTTLVFIFFFFSGTAVYHVKWLGNVFSPLRNRTIIGIISVEDGGNVEMVSVIINNFFIPFGAFLIIVVCTSILSYKLRSQSTWRQKTTASSQDDRVSSRNRKAAKMVLMISVLFIVCFIPVSVIMLAMSFIPELLMNGKYIHITVVVGGFGFVLEGINFSMNIFIYFYMSSIYRHNFWKCFRMNRWRGNYTQ